MSAALRPPELVWVGPVSVILSVDPPTGEAIAEIEEEMRARAATVGKVGCVLVLRPDGAFVSPDDAAKQALRHLLQARRDELAAILIVFAREGFAAAALRALVTGIMLLSRSPVPLKIVGRWDDGAPWFLAHLARAGVRIDRATLDPAVHRVTMVRHE